LPDRRAGGEVAVPPLRDLGGWSSVNAGTATTYVRSLPLPDGDGVAVLRLRGLAEPVHVAVDGGPERLVMPGAPVIVLEPAEGGGEAAARSRWPSVLRTCPADCSTGSSCCTPAHHGSWTCAPCGRRSSPSSSPSTRGRRTRWAGTRSPARRCARPGPSAVRPRPPTRPEDRRQACTSTPVRPC